MFKKKHIYTSAQMRLSLIVKKHKLNVYVLACTSLIGAAEYPSDPTIITREKQSFYGSNYPLNNHFLGLLWIGEKNEKRLL